MTEQPRQGPMILEAVESRMTEVCGVGSALIMGAMAFEMLPTTTPGAAALCIAALFSLSLAIKGS